MVRSVIPWTRRVPTFEKFENEMNRLMERFFTPEEGEWTAAMFTPSTNVVETETGYEVSVELPGMKPEEFNVEFKEGSLWISGEKKEEKEEKGKTYHRIERHYGEFRRIVPLPGTVSEEKVEAEYKDGVLKVVVPKAEAAKPKKIEVKS
jgi:HSP20 family protein